VSDVPVEQGEQLEAHPLNPRIFLPALLIGWIAIAFGLQQLAAAHVDEAQWSIWFLGALLAHDMIVAPLVFAVGSAVRRVVPGRVLAPIQGGLIASGLLLLFALPGLSGRGDRHGDSSRLPNDYSHGVTLVLVAVWAVTAVFLVRAWRRPFSAPERR
jgi:hypothetical protein